MKKVINIFKYILNRNKSFLEYANRYLDNNDYSKDKKSRIKSKIKFLKTINVIVKFKDVNKKNIQKINDCMIDAGYTTVYIKSIIYTVSSFVKEAISEGYLLHNPIHGYKIKNGKESSKVNALSKETLKLIEQTKFDNYSVQYAADIIVFCSHTGLSFIDFLSLKYEQIETSENASWITGKRNKNNIEYIVPLDVIALQLIKKYFKLPRKLRFKKKSDEYLFPFIRRESYYQILQKIRKNLKIKEKITPHRGRHTFATNALRDGVSIESIKKILGHKPDSNITWLYAEVQKDKIKKEFFK
ncbi:MAG: site-specific integrase [Prevotellaceae bacterium]|jgi:site-specific recombinase XerD|nr:site-specific integrase [Prevotellaceae bacterium]